MRAIRENGDDTDEFAAAGLTRERCEEINAPAIRRELSHHGVPPARCARPQRRGHGGDGDGRSGARARGGGLRARRRRTALEKTAFCLLAPGPQNMESGAPSPTAIGNFTPRLWD